MFDLNPLNSPNALVQHWIMLFVAGTLGFIIGYIARKAMIAQLQSNLARINRALADCRQPAAPEAAPSLDDDAVLRRIRARADELDFTRIGVATADEADDLKRIEGVSPYLEKKLHAIGLYTFQQLAALTKADVAKVNELIEFFPGRIERDNWVGQAAALAGRGR